MSMIMNILTALSSSLGHDAVRAECLKFASGKGDAKPKKEHKPRGKSSWNIAVDKVLEEMRAASDDPEKVTYKIAYAEAGRRKRENDPDAQAKYEAYRQKLLEKRAAKKGTADPVAAVASAPTTSKTPASTPAVEVVQVQEAQLTPVAAPETKKKGRATKA
jgi:YD repeat-containing protein